MVLAVLAEECFYYDLGNDLLPTWGNSITENGCTRRDSLKTTEKVGQGRASVMDLSLLNWLSSWASHHFQSVEKEMGA